MSNEKSVKDLKQKIESFIKRLTPSGAKYPVGIGWSIWNSFSISKDEAQILFEEKTFPGFFLKKTGTHFSYRAMVLHALSIHPELGNIVLSFDKKSPIFPYKTNIISSGLYEGKIDPDVFKDFDSPSKVEYLKICPSDGVERFLKDPSDKVRIAAYNRMGMLSCAEEMSKDKSAKVRIAICEALPHGHLALNNMIHDRSKWVFYSVLKKVDKSKIPLMLGSRHLKDGFIKSVLTKRMNNLGEK